MFLNEKEKMSTNPVESVVVLPSPRQILNITGRYSYILDIYLFCNLNSTGLASYAWIATDTDAPRRRSRLHSKPTPSRWLVCHIHQIKSKRQQSEGDNDRMAKKNKRGRKEGRKEKEDAGDCTSYLGRMHKRSHSSLHCCGPTRARYTLSFCLSLMLQWKCLMLPGRRNR